MEMYIISLVFAAMAFVVLLGKGDFLISGYNTASKEEKAKYDIGRLRLLVFVMVMIVSIGISLSALLEWDEVEMSVFAGMIVVLSVISTVLANCWAKKR